MIDSNTACTLRALFRFFKDDLQNHLLIFVHAVYPLLILAARSSFFPSIVPSMRVFAEASQPKAITSSLPLWHFFSKLSISALMTSFPLANSSSNPSKVESNAKEGINNFEGLTLAALQSSIWLNTGETPPRDPRPPEAAFLATTPRGFVTGFRG